MARDQPMTDAEIDELREEMDAQREAIREALAEDLGGDSEDYRTGQQPVADGGEE